MPSRVRRLLPIVLILAFALPLGMYAFLGTYSRLIADDYGVAVKAMRYGLYGALVHDYNFWFGRVSETLASSIATMLGSRFSMILPALLLGVWWLGLWWSAYEIARWLRLRVPIFTSIVLACVVLFGTLAGSPQLYQSIYWVNSIFTYAASMALFPYLPALILYGLRKQAQGLSKWLLIIALVILAFVAGAFSEPYAAAQTLALAGAFVGIIIALKTYRHRAPLLIFASLAGSIAAVVVLLLSPGNAVRQTNFERASSFLDAGVESVIHSAAFVVASVTSFSPGGALAAIVFSALLTYQVASEEQLSSYTRRSLRNAMSSSLITAFILIAAFMLPGIYATTMPPPARAYIISQGILILCLSSAGILLGLYARKIRRAVSQPLKTAVLVLCALAILIGPILTVSRLIPLFPLLSTFAHEWDIRDQMIREAAANGETSVRIPAYTVDVAERVGLDTIGADPGFWINRSAAAYYGLEALATE